MSAATASIFGCARCGLAPGAYGPDAVGGSGLTGSALGSSRSSGGT